MLLSQANHDLKTKISQLPLVSGQENAVANVLTEIKDLGLLLRNFLIELDFSALVRQEFHFSSLCIVLKTSYEVVVNYQKPLFGLSVAGQNQNLGLENRLPLFHVRHILVKLLLIYPKLATLSYYFE